MTTPTLTGNESIVLASTSRTRATILRQAGVTLDIEGPNVDEAAIVTAAGADMSPADLAELLARVKAETVSQRHPQALVIGADQTLDLDGGLMTKARDSADLRKKLLALRGRHHELHAAVACAHGGQTIWSTIDHARLTMREFSPEFLGAYMAREGGDLLDSVGGYRLEGHGAQLFHDINGDYFTILGLPLLPLLTWLREQHFLAI